VAAILLTVFAAIGSACSSAPSAGRIGQQETGLPRPSVTRTTALPQGPRKASTCSNASVIAGWPLSERLARVVAVPSLNFDLPQLSGVIAQGAGGVLFLGSAPAPTSLATMISSVQSSPAGHVPILTMADEEGGGIQRLQGVVQTFGWPRDLAASDSATQVEALATDVGHQMRAAGVDMDLAPVLDVDGRPGPSNSDPDGSRSFSAQPTVASSYGIAFAQGLEAGGVIPVVKHFPGLGGSTVNSDLGAAATVPLDQEETLGLPPFIAAIATNIPAVMVGNNSVPGLTAGPASLSSAAISGLLRSKLGFSGAVLTDSLSAGAVSAAGYTVPSAAVAAIEAGADLVLFGSTQTPQQEELLAPSSVMETMNAIVTALTLAVHSGSLPVSRVDAAVGHVIALQNVDLCR